MVSVRVSLIALCLWVGSLPLAMRADAQSSGIDTSVFDRTVRAQDDFYRYANGKRLDGSESVSGGSGSREAQIKVYDEMRSVLASPIDARDARDPDLRKLTDLYRSFMDERTIESSGITPLRDELRRVGEIANTIDVARTLARLMRAGVSMPVTISVHPDDRESTQYMADLEQSGLGLPDRDYYLAQEPRFEDIRAKYVAHIERMLALAGVRGAATDAAAVVALETRIAGAQWSSVDNRDPVKTYNRVQLSALETVAPGLHWSRVVAELGLVGKTTHVNVSEPTYFRELGTLVQRAPLSAWRAYFRWSLISHYAPFLSTPFVQERLAFSQAINGAGAVRPRWLRGVGFVDDRMGDALGRAYVERYFPPHAKARADTLVVQLVAAFRRRIQGLDWMSVETKREAQAKLSTLTIKLGYPKRWQDYTSLRTSPTDLIGNIRRARSFRYDRDLDRLGKRIDREEWAMSALTVNGSYSAVRNEIVLPAALIQPPYFNAAADDAANYGGLGWFIAHELSHAFDNRGNQYDSRGSLRDWWTPNDHAEFSARSNALIEQYSRYEPVRGVFINGALTVGENIADNLGLAIAFDAYRQSLGTRTAPVLDGLTGEQRFYSSFATIWAGKDTDANLVRMLKSDTHAPGRFRVLGALVNQDPFYTAFDVREGDTMYVPPSARVRIW